MEYFAQGRREYADALSPSVNGRTLVHELRAAYDAALSRYDALVLPTVPFKPRS